MKQWAASAALAALAVVLLQKPARAQSAPDLIPGEGPQPWPHVLPFLGKKAAERGINLQLPIGIGVNYLYMAQDINIDRIALSANDNPTQNADFIKFRRVQSKVSALTLRPDLWILPFLSVYGIVGVGNASAKVELESPISLKTTVEQAARTWGFGLTGAFGFEGFWLSADLNWSWTSLENLIDPVSGRVFSARAGKAFRFPGGHSLSLWAGTMHQHLVVQTQGHIRLDEALPPGALEGFGEALAAGCDNLSGPQAILCNQLAAQYDPVKAGANVVNYDLDKSLTDPWNLLVGAQYAFEPHWYVRTEVGFIGRVSFLLSMNYRFGLGWGD